MRRALLLLPFFVISPVSAAEITSRVVDSVQLTVDGPVLQSTRVGSSYSVSGSNISVTTLGTLNPSQASITNPATLTAGSYSINTDGQAFTFSETALIGDVPVTTQTQLTNNARVDAPVHYGNTTQSQGGAALTLAGTLSPTGIPTVTAGGPGTTAIGQRTIELTVFK